MRGPIELAVRLAVRLRRRLRSSRRFRRIYQNLSQDISFLNIYTNMPVHEKMLADTPRLDAYYRAITKYVQPGHTVIDLGTGTGILSFLAAQRGSKRIYAIDHADTIDKARLVAEHNGFTNIEFMKVNSRNLRLAEKVDLIIQEQIGTGVIDEDMVGCVTDLRNRLLKPGGRIIPSRFEVFVEPVKLRDDYRIPSIWEHQIYGVSFACLRSWYEREIGNDCGYSYVRSHQIDYLLCEPERVMAFDLMTMEEKDLPRTVGYVRRIERTGRLDGFCLFFRARFDDEIVLSNSPSDRSTHWAMPFFRVPSKELKRGDAIEFKLSLGNLSDASAWIWSCQ